MSQFDYQNDIHIKRPQKIKPEHFFYQISLSFAVKVTLSSSTCQNRIMIKSIWCRATDGRRNHLGSCRLSYRSLLTAPVAEIRLRPASGGLEDETESVGRQGTRRNDVTQGRSAGEGQGIERAPGPHPSRVGRRMWQSLSLITHTHTMRPPMRYALT